MVILTVNYYELITFILYFIAVIFIGIYFFVKSKNSGGKEYFIGSRNMNGIVAGMSAGASDMSAWVLMGLPGAVCLLGLGQVWIAIGLLIGTILAWVCVAPRLRRFAITCNDSITIPEFLTNRFKAKNATLQIACAIIFVIGYCIYTASSISACGDVFTSIIEGANKNVVMIVASVIILLYTILGGFKAVCWTDFIQGIIMLIALMAVPIIANIIINTNNIDAFQASDNYYNLLSSGKFDYKSISDIITGLGWGLGYFGMPHILVRYMSVKSEKEMKVSKKIGIFWIFIILGFSVYVGLIGREYLGDLVTSSNKNLVFINLVHKIFEGGAISLIGGLFLSAIIAAAMSTADSQLLASSSAFSTDIYKKVIKKDASDKEVLIVGRISVCVVLIIALLIALFGNQDIMGLVSCAWSVFGSAFGPAIILSLFWKKFTYKGCYIGIITGFIVSVLWMVLFNFDYYGFNSVIYYTNIYEIVPGFIFGMLASLIVTLLSKEDNKEAIQLFDKSINYKDEN